jgi:hypothetical protein
MANTTSTTTTSRDSTLERADGGVVGAGIIGPDIYNREERAGKRWFSTSVFGGDVAAD